MNVRSDWDAKRTPTHSAVEEGHANVLQLLIAHGAQTDVPDKKGVTPVALACTLNNAETVKLLLDAKANPKCSNARGRTPLHTANSSVAKLLLAASADPEASDDRGDRPLHTAVRAQNFNNVLLLCKSGADPTAANHQGKSPRDIALQLWGPNGAITYALDMYSDPKHRSRSRSPQPLGDGAHKKRRMEDEHVEANGQTALSGTPQLLGDGAHEKAPNGGQAR